MAVPDLAVHRPGPLPGWVYLVGAGPGDPGYSTLRGARLVAGGRHRHDNLVARPSSISRRSRPSASTSAEGRRPLAAAGRDQPAAAQAGAGEQARGAAQGRRPFIFGRGGEMELLVEAGIHVEVVPGVTAAAGVSAYAGIPLTHREHAQSVVFATGFPQGGQDRPRLADAGTSAADRGDLHGHLAPGGHLRQLVATACRPSTPRA